MSQNYKEVPTLLKDWFASPQAQISAYIGTNI